MRILRFWPLVLLASTGLALPQAGARGPTLAGLRIAAVAAEQDAPRSAVPVRPAPAPRRPAAWPYVLSGAVLGGALMVGGLALALRHEDSLTHPVAYVPAVAGAAALGAGGGYLVYRLRF